MQNVFKVETDEHVQEQSTLDSATSTSADFFEAWMAEDKHPGVSAIIGSSGRERHSEVSGSAAEDGARRWSSQSRVPESQQRKGAPPRPPPPPPDSLGFSFDFR